VHSKYCIALSYSEITKHLSLAVMGVSECWVSIGRIQKFLESPELETKTKAPLLGDDSNDDAMVISNATCHWNIRRSTPISMIPTNTTGEENSDEFESAGLIVALNNINLEFAVGQLTCIIGEVGSGKSALIQMLAGELPPSTGTIRQKPDLTMSYAPQDPWIMDGTVRENILLGRPFDDTFYNSIVNACGLSIDLAQLRDGEQTIVGDRGVQLSGGQRARIALARAFYCDSDIILLDDPLSAVDSKVGRLLFYSAIQDLGLKRGKCVVLVTHQHQFIGDSRCVMMRGGNIACVGTYRQCVAASNGRLTLTAQNTISQDDLTALDRDSPQDSEAAIPTKEAVISSEKCTDTEQYTKATDLSKDDHKEASQVGDVKLDTFLNYLRAMPGGLWTGFFMLILFVATQGSALACIAAVGTWSGLPAEEQTSWSILGVIVGLVFTISVLAIFRAFLSFHLTVQASKRLHDDMTRSVLRSRIEFFDTNPIGRILNRFSADVGSNDDLLPTTLFDFLVILFLVLGALISAVSVIPVTLVFIPPLVWYFARVRRTFVATSRELKRMEGLARSPIFAMLSESFSGIATIRSNNALEYFQKKFQKVHDVRGTCI
jgi:ATP-binding cassette subfamily C (CFTR/MRP) protein 4